MPEFQFQSFSEFLAMGGHALYVWASYAFFAAVIAFNLIQPAMAKRKIIRQHKALLRREAARLENQEN
jgi:heme exporter protein D